ncbi:MAG TPA: ABC transporter permease [Rhizomicrobium sp.]|nr:ABC transporter permease [Rhizomicrobium sp.]
MNPLLISIAVKHLLARKRQSVVSLLGIILGVAFFLAISSMMQGSEQDFIKRLVDNSPHITVQDEFRNPTLQPADQLYPQGAVQVRDVKPETETRGIRNYRQILEYIRTIPGAFASPSLQGQALVDFAGKDETLTLNGIIPSEIEQVSTIGQYMKEGAISDLESNSDGIILGSELVRKLSLRMNENITVSATTGQVHTFQIVGIFHTGRAEYDEGQAFVSLKRVQSLMNRPNRINNIVVKLKDPYQAQAVAAKIEARGGYKSVSWQEQSEDLMSTLMIRNIIMYSVVSAVLIVAAFGIYNIISTVVMEKQRDIAILRSMGFHARDIERIFLFQGAVLGLAGCATGLPLGMIIMAGLMSLTFKFPGSDPIHLPLDWSWVQFAIAGGFAIAASTMAALMPARKAARVQPVDILRGAQ